MAATPVAHRGKVWAVNVMLMDKDYSNSSYIYNDIFRKLNNKESFVLSYGHSITEENLKKTRRTIVDGGVFYSCFHQAENGKVYNDRVVTLGISYYSYVDCFSVWMRYINEKAKPKGYNYL